MVLMVIETEDLCKELEGAIYDHAYDEDVDDMIKAVKEAVKEHIETAKSRIVETDLDRI